MINIFDTQVRLYLCVRVCVWVLVRGHIFVHLTTLPWVCAHHHTCVLICMSVFLGMRVFPFQCMSAHIYLTVVVEWVLIVKLSSQELLCIWCSDMHRKCSSKVLIFEYFLPWISKVFPARNSVVSKHQLHLSMCLCLATIRQGHQYTNVFFDNSERIVASGDLSCWSLWKQGLGILHF